MTPDEAADLIEAIATRRDRASFAALSPSALMIRALFSRIVAFSGCTVADPAAPCTFSSVGEIAGIANSTYHALQTSLQKRFGHGVSLLASYTFSKTLDDASSFNITGSASQSVAGENDLAQNPFDISAEHGRSLFDARHRFVISYQWNLP